MNCVVGDEDEPLKSIVKPNWIIGHSRAGW
jgi:hypothetical protein